MFILLRLAESRDSGPVLSKFSGCCGSGEFRVYRPFSSSKYDPYATMTSRFGKTYSRKGGEGTSKFDEVLSTKRGTLSTKWGDTTYKAKVGCKRAGPPRNDSVLGTNKRPCPSGDDLEDPFGFDSDEESKPVSSRSSNKASPAKPASAEPPRAERPGMSVIAGNSVAASDRGASSWLPVDRKQPRAVEDTARFLSSSSSSSSTGSVLSAQNQHSYSWYQNASESDRKPLAQTTTLKTGSKVEATTYDSWDAIMGLRPPSPSPEPWNPAPAPSLVSAGSCERGSARREKAPSPPHPQSPSKRQDVRTDSDFVLETTDFSQTSSSSLGKNSNCRTYRRPNKQGPASKASALDPEPPSAQHTNKAGGRGRGRTRDYTVLHPSAVSVSNITIQNRGVDEFPTDAAAASSDGAAGLGSATELGAGWQRKKVQADPQVQERQ